MKKTIFLISITLVISCNKNEPLPNKVVSLKDTTYKTFVSKAGSYSLINSTTGQVLTNKWAPGFYETEETYWNKYSFIGSSLNNGPTCANGCPDYRFWDVSSVYLDYNHDGYLDMFAFLTLFKNDVYGISSGKFLLVDNVLGTTPKKTYSESPIRFPPRMKLLDINNDGSFEILVTSEEDHLLFNGTQGLVAPIKIISIDKNGVITTKELGAAMSAHGVTSGDIDNDGDQDILVWRNNYTEIYQTDLPCMPFIYTNDGNGNFKLEDSFQKIVGLDEIIAKLPSPGRRSYGASVVELFDIDNDGILDIIMALSHTEQPVFSWEYTHPTTRIYWGKGKGVFDFKSSYTDLPNTYTSNFVTPSGGTFSPIGFNIFDYDNDGDMDLISSITPDYGGFFLQLHENLGSRKFQDVTNSKISKYSEVYARNACMVGVLPDFYNIRPLDVDGDGDLDLVPSSVATWLPNKSCVCPINVYWENKGGVFTRKN